MAARYGRRTRRLFAFWRSEKRTLRQGFVALLASTVTAFVAGITLASITHTLEDLPGLIILIPAVLGMRGTIFGAMGARLGTSTHAGIFEASRARTGVLYQNVLTAGVQVLTSSLYLAGLAKLSAIAFGLESISFLDFVTISVVGGLLDSLLILAVTIGLSILSFRRGYDLDTVSTPLVTATADMATVPFLWLATFLVRVDWLSDVLAALSIGAAVLALARGATTRLPMARRILREMTPTIVFTPLLDILAGTVVEARLERFVALPGLLVLIPPFVADAGSLGGMLASRLSSKLQLGLLSPRGKPESAALLDASLTFGFGLVAFAAMGALGLAYSALVGLGHPGVGPMVGGTLVAGIMATLIAIPVSYYVAVWTTRFRWDPDNHSVPWITSVMDLAGTACLLVVLALFGVASHA